jgi:FKBP-type peptidyl-prolyl cis-trans isomerase 2
MDSNRWILRCFVFVFSAVLVFSGRAAVADEGKAVKKGDKVTVGYTGTLEDGTVFDSSENHDAPLKFVVGSGQVIEGFDKAVTGMKVGEEKTFTLSPAEAYGEADPKRVQKVPRGQLPPEPEPKVGMGLIVGSPDGGRMRATISEVTSEFVTLDMNHPLAGKALTFKIKLASIDN